MASTALTASMQNWFKHLRKTTQAIVRCLRVCILCGLAAWQVVVPADLVGIDPADLTTVVQNIGMKGFLGRAQAAATKQFAQNSV